MKTKVNKLLNQIRQAQNNGRTILKVSGLNTEGVIYAFATPETLVINCCDDETTWRFDEGLTQLWQTLLELKSSVNKIVIEKGGKTCYTF